MKLKYGSPSPEKAHRFRNTRLLSPLGENYLDVLSFLSVSPTYISLTNGLKTKYRQIFNRKRHKMPFLKNVLSKKCAFFNQFLPFSKKKKKEEKKKRRLLEKKQQKNTLYKLLKKGVGKLIQNIFLQKRTL